MTNVTKPSREHHLLVVCNIIYDIGKSFFPIKLNCQIELGNEINEFLWYKADTNELNYSIQGQKTEVKPF